MMERSSSQYDSFLFWREPIPTLDLSDLEELGLVDLDNMSDRKGKNSKVRGLDNETELLEFSSFNYWRAPIADVDSLLADLNLLL
ncbi:protein AF1q [Cynoglossus semilaevis]|uniref:protein AF1q n=1 Tax=Cynoglossus semilaevis TaxID=244447 RepID=UPI0004976E6B|nr:protein AF1q [Cynoglossus semilaevis]